MSRAQLSTGDNQDLIVPWAHVQTRTEKMFGDEFK